MKQQATQMMWFYDRQHEQWSLSDHLSCQPWQGEGAHPWASQLAPEDESGFADFLARLHHSGQPGQFIGIERSLPPGQRLADQQRLALPGIAQERGAIEIVQLHVPSRPVLASAAL